MRHLAPAGAPIRGRDLVQWMATLADGSDPSRLLRDCLADWAGVPHCYLTSTGRAGMTVIIRALRRLAPTNRDEVIVPSYTCCSTAASVIRAGLTPRLADVSTETLDFNYDRLEQMDFRRVLAVVATNLYGLPSDMVRLTELSRRHGFFLVDDAAQALGATLAGKKSGAWGDIGLYSFDKGKNVSAIDGGAIMTRSDDVSAAVHAELAKLPPTRSAALGEALIKLAAYSTFLAPRLYWIPNSVPQLGLGTTIYPVEFPVARYAPSLAALALTMLGRLDEFTAHRRGCAEYLLSQLGNLPGVRLPAVASSAQPAYLRFPLLLPNRRVRDTAVASLNDAGVGATGSYPSALADIPDLCGHLIGSQDDTLGGRAVAERIMTLPTHPYVTTMDLHAMAGTLRRLLAASSKALQGTVPSPIPSTSCDAPAAQASRN